VANKLLNSSVGGKKRFPALDAVTRSIELHRAKPFQAMFLFGDTFLLTGAVWVSRYLREVWPGIYGAELSAPAGNPAMSAIFVGLTVTLLALSRVYLPFRATSPRYELLRIVGVVSFASICAEFLGQFAIHGQQNQALRLLMWMNSTVFLAVGRVVVLRGARLLGRNGASYGRVVVVGDPQSASWAVHRFSQNGGRYRVVGIVTLGEPPVEGQQPAGVPVMGDLSQLPRLLHSQATQGILLAVPAGDYGRVRAALDSGMPKGRSVQVSLYPTLRDLEASGPSAQQPSSDGWKVWSFPWQYESLKRVFDLAVVCLLLVVAAPLMGLIALAIKLDSPGPVLFRQTRVGRRGLLFEMYKFRSMCQDAETQLKELLPGNEASGPMFKMRRDPRVTRVGRIIRRLSLDEIPQLFNVLEGSMSLVGPRPPLPEEVAQYRVEHFQRLEAFPGITGLWQVNRGWEVSFDEVMRLDMEYMQSWSLGRDIAILLKTIPAVISGRGAY